MTPKISIVAASGVNTMPAAMRKLARKSAVVR
jgi:hypothetical protein